MKKIDYKKELKHLYKASAKKVEFVDVPKMNFLMIDGKGDPNTSLEYKEAVEALYAVSYTLKFLVKRGEIQIDYGVMPLEGLWWVDDMNKFDINNKDRWQWTSMIMQPELITKELVEKAIEQVKQKKNPKALYKIRFEVFNEGKSAQIMHIGPFSEEGPTIQKAHDFISNNNYTRKGKHHEIYLSDIRRAAPEKWKTIIRQPIE
ncbi:MAG: GyrI-like domain-containing protein [Flavobacteriaceae bacterium]|nr:GyrI-like domain-containing protein [Flavobacteriaceae bacterium]